jgi:hypothetical protein
MRISINQVATFVVTALVLLTGFDRKSSAKADEGTWIQPGVNAAASGYPSNLTTNSDGAQTVPAVGERRIELEFQRSNAKPFVTLKLKIFLPTIKIFLSR